MALDSPQFKHHVSSSILCAVCLRTLSPLLQSLSPSPSMSELRKPRSVPLYMITSDPLTVRGQMLTASWLKGGYKTIKEARSTPYASGSIIPGSNYSAQDNHDSLKIAGM
eukprot:754723-Hanusia_phi.AAC.2